jgi:hypothetical protein
MKIQEREQKSKSGTSKKHATRDPSLGGKINATVDSREAR